MPVFDWRYELANIYTGMDRDLQKVAGQTIPWYTFDTADTVVDSIYDVGGNVVTGRRWNAPVKVPCLGVIKLEGTSAPNERGLYVVDTISIVISPKALRGAGLGDMLIHPETHVVDRVIYEGKVFEIDQVRVRGDVRGDFAYAVVAVDGHQVKVDELVNDIDFAQWMPQDLA